MASSKTKVTTLASTLLFLLAQIPASGRVEAKVVRGYLRTGDNWTFLSRFCFLSVHGKFQYEVMYEARFGVQNIDLYYDAPTQWERVYGGRNRDLRTCREKESVLQVENNQFINLTTELDHSGCRLVDHSNSSRKGVQPRVYCKGVRNFNTARERWWFMALSNCNSTKGLQLQYTLTMTNGRKGDLLHYHFSADEFYILPILVVAFVEHLVLLFLAVWSAVVLRMRQLLHSTYKLFLLSVFLHTVGVFLLGTHYLVYALDGEGHERAKLNGRVLEAAAQIVFLLLLILIAKGYTVTRARLRQASVIKVTIFISIYCIKYFILFVVELRYFDPGQVLYRYESMAGYGLMVLGNLGWFMFIYSTFFTLKHYPEKGSFYYPFFCFYTLYFIAGPTMIMVANHVVAQWVREKVVTSVEHFVMFLGHVVFLLLTRPNAHNKNFPYHVRTTQIGILEAMDEAAAARPNAAANGAPSSLGNGNVTTLDNFSHGGPYTVTEHATAMDIFTVDTVGSRRQYSPAVPPPYSAASGSAVPAAVPPAVGGGARRSSSSPTWAENSRRKNSAAAVVNGVAGSAYRPEANNNNGGARIYDPNDEDED